VRRIATAVLLVLAAVALWKAAVFAHHATESAPSVAIYDSNPSHLWNRLYAALLVRTDRRGQRFGDDSLDPMLWLESEHLLSNPSHQNVVRALDEFLETHGENLVRDPIKRAILERDLWAVFDWSVAQFSANQRPHYEKEKQELQLRLSEALRRMELTPDQITALPNTYAQAVASGDFAKAFDPNQPDRPFLPPDLFDPQGPWVCIQPSPESDLGVTPMHLFNYSGRSGFLVFVRLPAGRKATMDYFQTLWKFPEPYTPGPGPDGDQAPPNSDLPSFPAGTQVALVRRMTLFDSHGELQATAITESVQIRVYRAITTTPERDFGNGNLADIVRNSGQLFYEFKLSRPLLFAGKNGGLRAVERNETEFSTFQQGDDLIDAMMDDPPGKQTHRDKPLPELQTCIWCHSGGGVRSLNSRASLLKPNRMQKESPNPDYGPIYWADSTSVAWKQNRYDWGVLNGYWKAAPSRP
jgi:hypothetical protein